MQWIKDKKVWVDILWECFGSFLIAIALYNFALNAKFPMTGFSGIAMIFYRLYQAPIGITTIILNIPVAIICYRLIGRDFLLRSLRCMVISSLVIDYIAPLLPLYNGNRMLAAIVTGTLGGIAFLSDIGIILVGGIIFKDMDGIIYGMIINFLFAIVVDRVMCGLNSGKVALIVTERGEEVCDLIDECCGRGSTILDGRGGYKKNEKQVVMVACNSKQMYQVEKTVKRLDEEVFIIVMDANEIHGEGFRVFG